MNTPANNTDLELIINLTEEMVLPSRFCVAVSTDDVFGVLAEELTEEDPFFFSRGGQLIPTLAEWLAQAA